MRYESDSGDDDLSASAVGVAGAEAAAAAGAGAGHAGAGAGHAVANSCFTCVFLFCKYKCSKSTQEYTPRVQYKSPTVQYNENVYSCATPVLGTI